MDNISESFNEFFIVFVCYHLMIISDFVDPIEVDVKDTTSYSLVIIIALVTLFYISSIILTAIMEWYTKRKEKK